MLWKWKLKISEQNRMVKHDLTILYDIIVSLRHCYLIDNISRLSFKQYKIFFKTHSHDHYAKLWSNTFRADQILNRFQLWPQSFTTSWACLQTSSLHAQFSHHHLLVFIQLISNVPNNFLPFNCCPVLFPCKLYTQPTSLVQNHSFSKPTI